MPASIISVSGEAFVNTATADRQEWPSTATLNDGGYVVTWTSYNQDGSAGGIYAQRYNADGTPFGGETLVNTTMSSDQVYASIAALGDGGYVIGWMSLDQDGSGYGIYTQRYNADGTRFGGETLVNTTTADHQQVQSMGALADGGYVVAWSSPDGSGYGIYTQRYHADGTPFGGETLVNTTIADHQLYSATAGLAGGGYVITWMSYGQDGSEWGIYSQRYGADGTPSGGETLVNTSTASSQHQPAVTALEGGGYVVAWMSYEHDGGDIYAQRYNADGTPSGGETLINVTTAGDQSFPAITALHDDRYAVGWTGNGPDGFGVYVQLFATDGTPDGGEILVGSNVSIGYTLWLTTLGDGRVAAAWTGYDNSEYGVVHAIVTIGGAFIEGTSGNDILVGTSGDDVIAAYAGDDMLLGGLGNDTLYGGAGFDIASYADASGPVTVALDEFLATGALGDDTLNSIENIIGSAFGDTIVGDGSANVLSGLGGNDTLVGGDGNDTLDGGDGNDFLAQGGLGNDTLLGGNGDDLLFDSYGVNIFDGGAGDDGLFSYSGAAGQILSGGAGNDYLYDNGNSTMSGGDGDDTLFSNGFNSILSGGAGNDILSTQGGTTASGGDGNDTLQGGAGNDALTGDAGNDYLKGGGGNNVLNGGGGWDRVAYGDPYVSSGVTVNLNLQGSAQSTGQGMDTLIGIENVSGTAFADTLIGDSGDNWLWGLPGGISSTNNDTLTGGGGNDLLTVGIGNHTLSGGSGTDTVQFTENGGPETGLRISLALQGSAQATSAGSWTLNGIENLSGGTANDDLTGDGGNNVLAGGGGNDALAGGAGNDTLYGDGLIGIAVGILANAGADSNLVIGGSGPITLFANIANGNDRLDGGKGDDVLFGGGGDDVLTGGAGVDRFVFGVGSGHDHITDYTKGEVIAINGVSGVTAFSNLIISNGAAGAVISWGTADMITLDGFKAGKLTASDFSFGTSAASSSTVLTAAIAAAGPVGSSLSSHDGAGNVGFAAFENDFDPVSPAWGGLRSVGTTHDRFGMEAIAMHQDTVPSLIA